MHRKDSKNSDSPNRFAKLLVGIGVVVGLHPLLLRAATTSVGDYATLTNVVASSASGDTIVLTNNITVSAEVAISAKGLIIEGNNYSISVPGPGLNDSGVVNASPSAFRVFNVSASGKTNAIRNMIVKGGRPSAAGGGILNTSGTLILEGVTIAQSGGGSSYGGGGVVNSSGTLYLHDCNISRNAARYGGGFLNTGSGAKMFIERCTFSENRSMALSGGGGAGENQQALYANNSTFANNKSTELGGAINNTSSGTAYFVNCTFVGNIAYGTFLGGAIANNGGTVTLVNSLFAYNYRNNGGTYVLDDINTYSGTKPTAYSCIFQSSTDQLNSGSVGTSLYPGNASGSDDSLFCGGATAKVLGPDGTEVGSGTIYQPFLAKVGASPTPTTVLQTNSFAFGKGVHTAFSSATTPPVVGYYNGSSWVTLSGADPASHEVTTGQDGNVLREPLTAGSVNATATDLFMLKVNSAASGTVSGGTIYGDVYPSGTTVTLTAIPDSGYRFSEWDYVLGGSGVASTANPFALTLTTDVTLLPVFVSFTGFTVSYAGNGATGGTVPAEQLVNSGGSTNISGAGTMVKSGSVFAGWNTRSDGNGTDYAPGANYGGPANLSLYAKWMPDPSPTITRSPASQTVVLGGTVELSVSASGTAPLSYQWLKDGRMLSGAITSTLALADASVTNAGVYYVVVTNAYGLSISQPATVTVGTPQLMAWGWNDNGQLGDGTVDDQYSPESVATNVVLAAGGLYHSLFVKGNGTLWAMGYNNVGQLGDGTTNDSYLPKSVASNVVTVAAGSSFSLFLKGDGALWAMGYNGAGQLGDNTLINRSNAVAVIGGTNVVTVAAGFRHSLFLKNDGTLWAMGLNDNGQLGDGTMTQRQSPVSVASNVVTMVAGRLHSLFVKADGTLWAMGNNASGQLGDNTLITRSNAVAVAGGSNVVAAAAGQYHSLFLKSDGTLWAMGNNAYGQLGDGTTDDCPLPKSVASNVVAVASGREYSLFIKNDGSLWAMGTNAYGQLGDGTTMQRKSPIPVTGMALANIIAGCSAHQTFGVGMPLLITSQPTNQTVVVGNNATFTVAASGIAAVGYQWQFNAANLSGATATNYTLTGVAATNAGDYTVVISNLYGSVTSCVAVLTVNKATPIVTTWPTATAITYGQTLADSTLSGGSASVDGSFLFTAPGTVPGTGTAAQNVTFTPTDSANYNTVGSTVSVTVNATGQTPVAVNDTLGTVKNRAVTNLPAAKLAANDTDADNDPLTVTAVSATSTNNGTVTLAAGIVTYTPPTGVTGTDSFTYTIADGHGNAATGTVLVTIASSTAVSLNLVYGPVKTNGQFVVRFAGTPGSQYTIEYSSDLSTWTWKANRTAPVTAGSFGKGVFEFRETTAATVRFYRTVYPAYDDPLPQENK